MVAAGKGLTLSEVARFLEQPQHRLIHLCEKGVIHADLEEARGRGSSRRFSARNLLEFAVALKLRELSVPVTVIGAVIHVLRSFEKSTAKEMPGFQLPESLQEDRAPDLRAIITDKRRLYFALVPGRGRPRLYGGIDVDRVEGPKRSTVRRSSRLREVAKSAEHPAVGLDPVSTAERGRIELSITGVARDLANSRQ